ncbi:dihydrodipicolinate synthase family protein [Candidatus Vidania fulgoroideae]|uniref:Dihydrodipicolinate synthase family protein n=1 Tax=Candidatus Vidania fulgoroideorum TaxID=881286 RepID=A0A975ADS2_9PROT|nr:dihydrodipicolinate synthase family protein [Candidatus Vidania fulgoroideae]
MFVNTVSVVTPMEFDSNIDYIGLLNLFRFNLVHNNTHFLVNATTGESLSLGVLEKIFIIRFLRFYFGSNIILYSGSCFCSTSDCVRFLSILNIECIDFVLQITPYYFIPSDEGILLHFTVLSLLSIHPIIVYNVPKRTALELSSNCLAAVLQLRNVFGLKDSSGSYLLSFERINLCYLYNKKFFCGDDTQFLRLGKCEVFGLVSVFSSCFPFEFCRIFTDVYLEYFYFFKSLVFVFTKVVNPMLIKYFLSMFLYAGCYYRLPLLFLDGVRYSNSVTCVCFYRDALFLYRQIECCYFFNEFN